MTEVTKTASPPPSEVLDRVFDTLSGHPDWHATASAEYASLAADTKRAVAALFGPESRGPQPFGPFGNVTLPYRSMGAIDSLDLFGLDELIIFSFYRQNRDKYRRVADIGANIGLHSLVLSRCGYRVRSFEPDPIHTAVFRETMAANDAESVELVQAAVSDHAGEAEFVRLLGNTTGSHLAGAKQNPYGKIDRFNVSLVPIKEIIDWADLMKIDAEGHEAVIILATEGGQWDNTDAMLEIGSPANAEAIFGHSRQHGLNIFTQRSGWQQAKAVSDLPTSYRDGSAFITRKAAIPSFGGG